MYCKNIKRKVSLILFVTSNICLMGFVVILNYKEK